MEQKLTRLLTPQLGLCFAVMLLFSIVPLFLGRTDVAIAELVVTVLVAAACYLRSVRHRNAAAELLRQVADDLTSATRDSTLNCPLPVIMFTPETDEIVWSSDRFLRICGSEEGIFDTNMADLCPGFSTRWLLEGKNECPDEVLLKDRRYQVFGNLTDSPDSAAGPLATTYWLDVTELADTRDRYHATRPVVSVLLLDNYEDTIKNQPDNVRTAMLSEINRRLDQWTREANGFLCQLERDRYLFVFEQRHLAHYQSEKFSVLDAVREVDSPSGIPVTLSIGVGVDGDSPAELFRFAMVSADMALSRGGDQAVVKNRANFEFYGGRTKETERRTKVKSRVMASALGELMDDASCVMVMGHSAADMDAVGAAVGVCAIARKRGVPAYIIRELGPTPADELYERVSEMERYRDCFLDGQNALLRVDSGTLLVVVDTNRPEQVSSRELLSACGKVAVIDHHRRAATYIEGAALNFHEPYASSASELVTELLTYLLEPGELSRGEAEALLAGLMLDTKNFTMRTGGRTFEAAAFLRRSGGDTAEVQKLFQTNLSDAIAKYDIIQNARVCYTDVAIAPVAHAVGRVTAAKAADELLNIAGINTSFVLYQDEDKVVLSARSNNDTNVQVIAEALGGGGNAAAAGAQMPDTTLETAEARLLAALAEYFTPDGTDPNDEA
ncbi:MAG: DHH family phosphoesterase [Oscillospiraceae bacterium]|nr:DHH family phosphoesterase [Oscillospiraceae bacterium]